MTDIVGRRIHAEWHDGTITQHVIGLPVIGGTRTSLIVASMSIANGQVAEKDDGRNRIVGVIHPNAVINTRGRVVDIGHLAKSVGCTHTKVIVFIPIGYRTRTDIRIGSLVLATKHSLTEAGLAVTEITSQATITHSEEIFIGVGESIHLVLGQLRLRPRGLAAVGSVVDKAST